MLTIGSQLARLRFGPSLEVGSGYSGFSVSEFVLAQPQFSGVGQSRRPLWAATSPGNLGWSREQGKGSTEWELDGTGEGGRDKDVLLCP